MRARQERQRPLGLRAQRAVLLLQRARVQQSVPAARGEPNSRHQRPILEHGLRCLLPLSRAVARAPPPNDRVRSEAGGGLPLTMAAADISGVKPEMSEATALFPAALSPMNPSTRPCIPPLAPAVGRLRAPIALELASSSNGVGAESSRSVPLSRLTRCPSRKNRVDGGTVDPDVISDVTAALAQWPPG